MVKGSSLWAKVPLFPKGEAVCLIDGTDKRLVKDPYACCHKYGFEAQIWEDHGEPNSDSDVALHDGLPLW